jgi:hypothetical protein
MTASSNQQPMFTPATLYAKTPKTMGAAVVKAMILKGMFENPGRKYWRSDVLDVAQDCHRAANNMQKRAEIETLGRELRGRGAGAGRQQAADRLFGIGWRVCADDGRVWVERT